MRGSLKARLPQKIFVVKCKQLYEEYLQQSGLNPSDEEWVKFSDNWLRGWMEEYRVSFTQTSFLLCRKLFARKESLISWRTLFEWGFSSRKDWRWRMLTLSTEIKCHYIATRQKTLTMKDCPTYVKENYMLSRERVTVFTQASSKNGLGMWPQFVFKGKGTILQDKLHCPEGVTTPSPTV